MADKPIYYCVGCGKPHPRGNFYKSYTHTSGVYPFCKDYIKKDVYINESDIDIEKLKNILRQADAPFLTSEVLGSIEEKRETVGAYFSRINMTQYRGYTWKNSDFQQSDSNAQDAIAKYTSDQDCFIDDDFIVTPEMRHRWGKEYTKEQIRDLDKFYSDMHMTHSIVTPQHEKALIMICKLQHKMDMYLDNEDMTSFSKLHGEYQKLLTSSGLRPIDKIGGEEATGMRSFSQIFEEVEKDGFITLEPVKENQDIVDRTIQYIMNYTLKLLNQQSLTEPPIDTPKGDKNGNL